MFYKKQAHAIIKKLKVELTPPQYFKCVNLSAHPPDHAHIVFVPGSSINR